MSVRLLKLLMHRPLQGAEKNRGSAASRGYDYRWQQYRKRFLLEHPLCARCEKVGRVELATVVDHVIPVSGADDPLFWDESNHQGLSSRCHRIRLAKILRKD